jgi:phosphomannomutase
MTDVQTLRKLAQAWITDDPDPETRVELEALQARLPESADELADRFAGRLTFGTAGLRGPVRAGPNGMNRAVVRGAAAGLMSYLDAHGIEGPVVIGYDARVGSTDFAQETAAVVTGAGRRALLLPRILPTPVLAYTIRTLGAAAGVMVTASHNPPADNGYKVYLGDGAQIVPPADAEIEAAIQSVGPLVDVPLGPPGEVLDDAVVYGYLDAVASRVDPASPRDLKVAYTPLHGVGGATLTAAFVRAGFAAPAVVAEQAEPDPAFPTVGFPNPEEPGAVDLLLDLARRENADIAIANDPDADRCAVAVPGPDGGWRMLRGDEVGGLLADHLMRRGATGTYATTIVSSSLLRAMTAARGIPYAETLTGFKWIMRGADDIVFGYEEALGYAVAPDLVRDKDGISAALLVAELAAQLKAEGRTLNDRLDDLAREFGLHATDQLSVRVDDLDLITEAMAGLRAALPQRLLGRPVEAAEDLFPAADVVILRAAGVRVVVRPSGTEPKLKAYLEVVEPVEDSVAPARIAAAEHLAALRHEVSAALGLS